MGTQEGRQPLTFGGVLGLVFFLAIGAYLVSPDVKRTVDRQVNAVVGGINDSQRTATPAPPPLDELRRTAERVGYAELFRNNEQWVGRTVYFPRLRLGQVVDEGGGEYSIVAAVAADPGETFTIEDDYLFLDYSGARVLEKDVVEVAGVVEPLYTYESTAGQSVTVPRLRVLQLRVVEGRR